MNPDKRSAHDACRGQALLAAAILIFIGTAITAGALLYISHEQRLSRHAAGWVDALQVAESGVEEAIDQFYRQASGNSAWAGWSNVTVDGRVKGLPLKDLFPDTSPTGMTRRYSVVADLDTLTVVSTGIVRMARLTNAMMRAVRVVLAPETNSAFQAALLAKSYVKHGGNASVDSFDSRDPAKSTHGQFDPFKRQSNGDIVTICTDPEAAVFATGSGVLYGDIVAGIGGGVTITGNYTNMGTVGSGADVDIADVVVPIPTALTDPAIKMSAAKDSMTITVAGRTDMSVSYVRMTGGTLTLSGSGTLRLYVDGDLDVSGSSLLIMTNSPPEASLTVEIYTNGDVLLNSCVNATGKASNLQIYGTSNCRDVKYTGSSVFHGLMYVPHAAYTFSGSGDFVGAVVAGTVDVTGTGDFHYDEALAEIGMPFLLGYRVAHWSEIR